MPKINWDATSRGKITNRILVQGRASTVTDEDVATFIIWKNSSPDVPTGDWIADFGSFKLVGTGSHLDSVLDPYMASWGELIYSWEWR